MRVAALLDVWGEKLGGPRAGVRDPVRAHARDGVDTTTTSVTWHVGKTLPVGNMGWWCLTEFVVTMEKWTETDRCYIPNY